MFSKFIWWNSNWIFRFQSVWQFSTSQHHFKKLQIIWYCFVSCCVFNFNHSSVIQIQFLEYCTSVINYQIISSLFSFIRFSIHLVYTLDWFIFQIEFKSSCCIEYSSWFDCLCSFSFCETINSTKMIQFHFCWIQNLRQKYVLTCIWNVYS